MPLLWQVGSWSFAVILGLFLFMYLFRKYVTSLPVADGKTTDPYFLAAVPSIVVPLILQFCVLKILRGIVMKRSALDIAEDVGRDIAITTAEVAAGIVVDAIIGGSGSTSGKSSSGGGTTGGGGSFGGGGASGGF